MMIMISLTLLQAPSYEADRDRSRETFPVRVHINSLEVMLIIVPIEKALELHKYFVQAVAKFRVVRMGLPRQRRGPEGLRYHQMKDPGINVCHPRRHAAQP